MLECRAATKPHRATLIGERRRHHDGAARNAAQIGTEVRQLLGCRFDRYDQTLRADYGAGQDRVCTDAGPDVDERVARSQEGHEGMERVVVIQAAVHVSGQIYDGVTYGTDDRCRAKGNADHLPRGNSSTQVVHRPTEHRPHASGLVRRVVESEAESAHVSPPPSPRASGATAATLPIGVAVALISSRAQAATKYTRVCAACAHATAVTPARRAAATK